MNPIVKEVFAHETEKQMEGPSTKRGEREGVAHSEVMCEWKCDLSASKKTKKKRREERREKRREERKGYDSNWQDK